MGSFSGISIVLRSVDDPTRMRLKDKRNEKSDTNTLNVAIVTEESWIVPQD